MARLNGRMRLGMSQAPCQDDLFNADSMLQKNAGPKGQRRIAYPARFTGRRRPYDDELSDALKDSDSPFMQ